MTYLTIYLLLINALSFLLMLVDKRKAIKNRWRISERTLFLTALSGGSLGILAGMYLFRHKTRHRAFIIGIPGILIVQCALSIWLYVMLK